MASKRGIALTIIALAGITAASFAIWLPQPQEATFVVTDYRGNLDASVTVYEVLRESLRAGYDGLLDGTISPSEYKEAADGTSAQVAVQIGQLVRSGPPPEWEASYISHMEAMRGFNSYITETKVLARAIAGGSDTSGITERLAELEDVVDAHSRASLESRPPG